jgi:hypothetical protein
MSADSSRIEVPDLLEFINRRKFDFKSEINCATLGTIDSFDSLTQSASIRINYKRVVKEINASGDNASSNRVVDYPLLVNCPVVFLQGGSGYLTFPIESGDPCLVLFCDRDIDNWFEYGTTEQTPNSERMHDLSDGIALVGIRSKMNPLLLYKTDGVKLAYGFCSVELDTQIKLAVGLITLKQGLDALCLALTSWVSTDNDNPNTATIAAINAAKLLIDTVLG